MRTVNFLYTDNLLNEYTVEANLFPNEEGPTDVEIQDVWGQDGETWDGWLDNRMVREDIEQAAREAGMVNTELPWWAQPWTPDPNPTALYDSLMRTYEAAAAIPQAATPLMDAYRRGCCDPDNAGRELAESAYEAGLVGHVS